MAKQQGAFSASDRAAELVPTTVEVGTQQFKVRRTGKALKEIIALAPDDETAEDPAKNIEMLYEGIALVLVDEQGNHPTVEYLEDELDFQVAQELMEKFLPRAEGNGPVEATSTPASADQA